MELFLLNRTTYADYAGCLPEEFFMDLMKGIRSMHAVGVKFMNEPCAAACFEEGEQSWVLNSIYVLPEYRHLGLGREMVAYIANRMVEKKCGSLTLSYECETNRDSLSLAPFFRNCGFMLEFMDVPMAVTDLETVLIALQEWNAFKKMGGLRPLGDLTTREKYQLNEWLIDMTGDRLSRYLQSSGNGYVSMRDGTVNGIVLFSRYDSSVRLDYCWVDRNNKQLFLPLLACAAKDLYRQFTSNASDSTPAQSEAFTDWAPVRGKKIEMILSTDQAMQLYTRLLEADVEETVLCTGKLAASEAEILKLITHTDEKTHGFNRVDDSPQIF